MKIIHEQEAEEIRLPGRAMKWLVSSNTLPSENMSVCVIRVPAGETVHPAHAHPNCEEFIYVMQGQGRIMVDGDVADVQAGTSVLFPAESIHMLQNSGSEDMKVICFFAPPADLSTYRHFEGISFPKDTTE